MSTTAATTSSHSLRGLLRRGAPGDELRSLLDGLSPTARVDEALSLRGSEVAKLYRACAGGPPVVPEDFVPASLDDDRTVIFEGRNSLPTFSGFQKRFARLDDEIVGYNHQTWGFVTGPGYFVVAPASDDADVPGELYFDYTKTPRRTPTGWPKLQANTAGLSLLVYAHMKDYMRSVAKNVVVGAAYKKGKAQNAFFLLCRA